MAPSDGPQSESGFAAMDLPLPPQVIELAAGRPVMPVWTNELGGLTVTVGAGSDAQFIKWSPHSSGVDLRDEAERMRWLDSYDVPTPTVLDVGVNGEGTWLCTRVLPGASAVAEACRQRPESTVRALGRALRAFHEALPFDECPFDWRLATRLAKLEQAVTDGRRSVRPSNDDFVHLSLDVAMRVLRDLPTVDRPVVCHGDACAPNFLLDSNGGVSGIVDVGSLGQGDAWADISIATWSTTWNYGPGWEQTLLDAYGIDADPERTHYYRLLWDLDS